MINHNPISIQIVTRKMTLFRFLSQIFTMEIVSRRCFPTNHSEKCRLPLAFGSQPNNYHASFQFPVLCGNTKRITIEGC